MSALHTRAVVVAAVMSAAASRGLAQTTKLTVLQAEDRRAATLQDLTSLRFAARSADPEVARLAVRALGRLERPSLVPDIVISLRHPLPEVRAEAANALAQATQSIRSETPPGTAVTTAQTALAARIDVETDATVRAQLCEALGRLPYASDADAARAEATLLAFAPRATGNTDRLGLAKALEALTRLGGRTHTPAAETITLLQSLARPQNARNEQDLLHDARVRRLALEALTTAAALDRDTVLTAATDPDPQVRRLAVRAASATAGLDDVIVRGLFDPAPIVRMEALRAGGLRLGAGVCAAALTATSDPEPNVSIVAIDQMSRCGEKPEAMLYLGSAVADPADAEVVRNWHRSAHALVALATASPSKLKEILPAFATSRVWQLRMYSARAAAILNDTATLTTLATDAHPAVAAAAIAGLSTTAGHASDATYIAALETTQLAVVRAAALGLDRTPNAAPAVGPLKSALERLDSDSRPGAIDVRTALRSALASLGVDVRSPKPSPQPPAPMTLASLRDLAAPRARFTVRDVGQFDVALVSAEAPATVLRFVELARSGYYNGLTFHRMVADSFVRGGSPDATDYGSTAPVMRDEVGQWPHVRGALGMFARGRDTGDGQIFLDLVDNPRFDHVYTVFGQILNGTDLIDRLLEGDVIDSIEIVQ